MRTRFRDPPCRSGAKAELYPMRDPLSSVAVPTWLPILLAAPAAGGLMVLLLHQRRRWEAVGALRVWPIFLGLCLLPLAALGREGVRDLVFIYFWLLALGLYMDAILRLITWFFKGHDGQRVPALFDLSALAVLYVAVLVRELAVGGFACESYQHAFPRELPAGLDAPVCRWPLIAQQSGINPDRIRVAALLHPEASSPTPIKADDETLWSIDLEIHPRAAGCQRNGLGAYVAQPGTGSPELVLCPEACAQHYRSITVMVRHSCELDDDEAVARAPLRQQPSWRGPDAR